MILFEGSNFAIKIGPSWCDPGMFDVCLAWNRRDHLLGYPVPEGELLYADTLYWYWSTRRFDGVHRAHYFMRWNDA